MTTTASLTRSLRACLTGLDTLLHAEILRLKARYQLSLDEFRGLYVSDEQVEALVRPHRPDDSTPTTARASLISSLSQHERLTRLSTRLDLSTLDVLLLLIAVAPGLDPKYETLYAYLNNDVTRKLASLDLVLRLLATTSEDTLAIRAAFLPGATLTSSGLIRVLGRDVSGAAQQTQLAAHPGLPDYLLGLPFKDEHIETLVQLREPAPEHALLRDSGDFRELLLRADGALADGSTAASPPSRSTSNPPRLILLQPSCALGARAFALAACSHWGRNLLTLDVRGTSRETLRETLVRVTLLAQLSDTALLMEGVDCLAADGRFTPEATALRAILRVRHTPILFEAPAPGSTGWPFDPVEYINLSLHAPSRDTRRALWSEALTQAGVQAAPDDIKLLARRFAVGPEIINAATSRLADDVTIHGNQRIDCRHLFAAAQAQTDTGLGRIAQRMSQRHTWEDLVLPPATRSRIRALIGALHSRERVLDEWGMGRALGTVGLRALFAGPSGTGKTMTAAVIARELGVNAYRIDLSQTVSKYIGETEKNLERIFQAAERAHAILFFDEADALLGKRAEVKDARDRYANIEVAYLLQRLEEFDGVVIVATNFSRNIDTAFARRMQFVIEFPLPGVAERERIWRSLFPPNAPVASDVDFDFLSRRFELAGGDIRNVVLDAAFLAAGQDQSIGMRHVTQALARELVKQGRSPSATDFRQHYTLLDTADQTG